MADIERRYWVDPLTWACNLGIFVFGIVLAVLGAILPSLFQEIHLNPAQAGSLFLFLNLGSLLMTLLSGPAFDRFGFRLILAGSSILVGGAFLHLSRASDYTDLTMSSFLLGLGGGGLNVGTNALVADLYPNRQAAALNRLGVFFGLGTLFVPLCIGILLDSAGMTAILLITAVIGALPAPIFLVSVFPPAKQGAGFPLRQAAGLLRSPFLLLLGILLFFQSGNEITTSGWLTSYLVALTPLSTSEAAFFLSGFWGALVLGRLSAAWMLGRLGAAVLVQVGAAAASAGLVLLLLLKVPLLLFVLVCLIGFFMSFVFPTVMGEASARFPGLSGTVLGMLLGIALTGGMLIPWMAGTLAGQLGLAAALAVPAGGFLLVLLLQTVVKRRFGPE